MNNHLFLPTIPNFIETQCASFCWFLSIGILESLSLFQVNGGISSVLDIQCVSENYLFILSESTGGAFTRYSATLTLKLFIPVTFGALTSTSFRPQGPSYLFIGELPLMTNRGTFIINGYEKICVNQLIRTPGLYTSPTLEFGVGSYNAVLVPQRGAWIRLDFVYPNRFTLSIDKGETINLLDFLNLCGFVGDDFNSFDFGSFSFNSLNSSKRDFKTILSLRSFRLLFQQRILNNNYYYLGRRCRLRLNQVLKFLCIPTNKSCLTLSDFFWLIEYFVGLKGTQIAVTDFDHLSYKYLRSIGELLQTQFFYGLKNLQRELRFGLKSPKFFDISNIFRQSKALGLVLQTFFSSSQLIQFLDQTNGLADLSHRRRLHNTMFGSSASKEGSLQKRDVHFSFFGRICPIETNEGNRAGLTSALAAYTRINELGFMETPFFLVRNGIVLDKFPVIYLTPYEEQFFIIALPDTPLTSEKSITASFVFISFQNKTISVPTSLVQLISVSSLQFFSVSVGLLPFFEHNDANRVLMGANMQRQAIPLIFPHKPIVGTGLETAVAATLALKSYIKGCVFQVTYNKIIICNAKGKFIQYFLTKFRRSNQNTCLTQRSIVWRGEFVASGQILADSAFTENGELALGQNILLAYMVWNGFNFEDSILINERLVFSDLFSSITILQFSIFLLNSNGSSEYFFAPSNFSPLNPLDANGIIRKGMFVKPFDVLVQKFKSTSIARGSSKSILAKLAFSMLSFFTDTSICAPSNCFGRILAIIKCSSNNSLPLNDSTSFKLIILVAQLRLLQVGDKLSGRHGNKGILAKILAQEDMPFLPNGQCIDIIFNPLGVPSRMNVGQLFEGLLGFAGNFLKKRFKLSPFDERSGANASRILVTNYLKKAKQFTKFFWLYNQFTPGKLLLRDGKTGNFFDNSILVCKSYILKLNHFVADKIQARSISGYSLVSQQPSHGKKFEGGQRFGEMEVWALEAFGAAYTLQELLTLKSDSLSGRYDVFNAILHNKSFVSFSIPESINVLLFELKALGLNIELYKLDLLV